MHALSGLIRLSEYFRAYGEKALILLLCFSRKLRACVQCMGETIEYNLLISFVMC